MLDLVLLQTDLTRAESIVLRPYVDTVGKMTIGVGRNLTDRGISVDEAMYLLKNDMQIAVNALDRHLGWWRNLSEPRQRVLVNMCFQMGITKLMQFKNMLAALKRGDYQAAHDSMLDSRWARQTPSRARRLAAIIVKK